ncbi:MAG: AraC family transcriptional regulator [Muribaculum sp.]|nr:AraC family transcriptional regulator [Muribaculum sp.]
MDTDRPIFVRHFRKGEGTEILSNLPFHIDDNFLIIVNVEGYGSMDVDFRTIGGSMPLLTYVNPGDVHGNIIVEESDFWCIKISPNAVPLNYTERMLAFPTITSPVLMSETLYESILQILPLLQLCSDAGVVLNREVQDNIVSLFFSMVVQAISEYPASHTESSLTPEKKIIRNLTLLIENNFIMEKQTKFYTDTLNISYSRLSELCKSYTGKSIQQMIIERVILESNRLLKFSELTVKEISSKLGYEDTAYFSRLYKAKTGKTPVEYRKSAINT